jgi:hypothetical protein
MAAPVKSGSLASHVGYGSTRSVSFSTTGTDKQVFAFIYADSLLSDISFDGGGLTWILLGSIESAISNKNCVKIYTARAATAITSQTLTLTKTGGATNLALHVQAWEGCPDYTGLVANTDFGFGSYNPHVEANPNPTVNVTTIQDDSHLMGVSGLLFWEGGYTAIANTTVLVTSNQGALIERNSAPLAIGSYAMGVVHGVTSGNWRATVGAFVEILGLEEDDEDIESGDLTSSGGASVAWVGKSRFKGNVSSSGVGAVSFSGKARAKGNVSSSGVGTVTLAGKSRMKAVWVSVGVAQTSFLARALVRAILDITATSEVNFLGKSLAKGILLSEGLGSFSALGKAQSKSIFIAEGTSAATFLALGMASIFSSIGEATVSFVGKSLVKGNILSEGISDVNFEAKQRIKAILTSEGLSEFSVEGKAIAKALFTSEGTSVFDAQALLNLPVLSSEGIATVLFLGSAIHKTIMNSSGQAQANWINVTVNNVWFSQGGVNGNWVKASAPSGNWNPESSVSKVWVEEPSIE